ncbi:hypothetical protein INT47_007878, partial [Mucor saturninus]
MDFPTYVAIYNYITRKTFPGGSTEAIKASIRFKGSKYLALKGHLYEKVIQESDNKEYYGRKLLHEGTIDNAILRAHNEGHLGVNNTWNKVKLQFMSKGLSKKVKELVDTCMTCQARRKIRNRRVTPGYPVPTPSRPFYLVSCDIVGPLEETPSGNKYIIVAVDYLTKWPIAAAIKDATAETTEQFIQDHIVSVHGTPSFLITDRGSNYVSTYLKTYLNKIECTHRMSTSRRPQSNGQVERMNYTLVQTMAKLRRDDGNKPWDNYIQAALMTIRTMTNEATGYTPSMLLYGYDMRTPSTWVPPRYDYIVGEVEEEIARRAKEIENWLVEVRLIAKENSDIKKLKRKVVYDKTVVPRPLFKIGDKVLMKDHYPPEKFADKFIGPLEVIKVNAATGTYHLLGPHQNRLKDAVHGDILVPFRESKRMIPDVMVTRAMIQFQS